MEIHNRVKLLTHRYVGNHRNKDYCIEYKKSGPASWEKIIAEKMFLRRIYTGSRTIQECKISQSRAKFLIVFSPDGTKLASTNGNHNVYIIDVRTKKILKTLSGHKRTPWTVAFHPTNNSILASGCLSGEVRVWNLEDDSCEIWQSPGQTVIASLSFHPKVKLLLIATYKNIYFWDWNASLMLGHTSTENEEEKIRYVKFDSSGDKLITAIALNGSLLSQYDSISLREVFHFTRERVVLGSIQVIAKFCERHLLQLPNLKTEAETVMSSVPNCDDSQQSFPRGIFEQHSQMHMTKDAMPYMCIHHHENIHSFLNIEYFCPTKFSQQIIDMFKKDTLAAEYFVEKCYFCRYTWLYRAVFQLELIGNSKNHICKEFRFMMSDRHVWKFDDHRLIELKRENEDDANGLTEETIRYCFEQYARSRIAPYFAEQMIDGVCSECSNSDRWEYDYSKSEEPVVSQRPFFHNVSMRSDCFLNVCEMFKFNPSKSFASFMIAFAELYQYLPALQQISTKNDSNILNSLMTEWEYLYCKLLLISYIVEGDCGLLQKRRCAKSNNYAAKRSESHAFKPSPTLKMHLDSSKQNGRRNDLMERQVSESGLLYKELFFKPTCRELMKESSTSFSLNGDIHSNETADSKPQICNVRGTKRRSKCDLCKPFDENYEKNNNIALRKMRKDLDHVCGIILRRNEPKVQRSRIEKLYNQQLQSEINRIDGALFRTIQVTKKCIRSYISSLLTELKKLVKKHFSSLTAKDYLFNTTLPRLFLFIVRRTVVFISNLLELLCNFKYDINELTEIESIKIASPPLFSTIPLRQYRISNNARHRRDYTFEIQSNDEPIFDEERETLSTELSDEEMSLNSSDNIFSGRNEQSGYIDEVSRPGSSHSPDFDISTLSARRVIASNIYLNKHVRFLDFVAERCPQEHVAPDNYQLLLLQNVNSLFNHFLCHSIEEISAEVRSNHPLHRLQMWDFSNLQIPTISSREQNIVVTECEVHNDATIAISSDDSRVAVLLSANQYDQADWLGVFSLEWKTLGHILCAISLKQIAVSLSFSPTGQHLVVGYSFTYCENLKMADIIAVQQEINNWNDAEKLSKNSAIATSLIDISSSLRSSDLTTVNCIKWIPVPGQGLVFGNSIGELKFVI